MVNLLNPTLVTGVARFLAFVASYLFLLHLALIFIIFHLFALEINPCRPRFLKLVEVDIFFGFRGIILIRNWGRISF